MIRNFWALGLLVFLFVACAGEVKVGEPVIATESISVSNLLSNPVDYAGQTVTLKGNIVSECPTGCWFNLQDEKGLIYVDIKPSGIAIPQRVGHKAIVKGKVVVDEDRVMLIGKGVEIE